jgi:hypothetical protein
MLPAYRFSQEAAMSAQNPVVLVEQLTGCAAGEVAQACAIRDLEAAQLLLDEALAIKLGRPVLRVVPPLAAEG